MNCRLVSKAWKRAADDPAVWRELLLRDFKRKEEDATTPSKEGPRNSYQRFFHADAEIRRTMINWIVGILDAL
jgi:hypothetical protein